MAAGKGTVPSPLFVNVTQEKNKYIISLERHLLHIGWKENKYQIRDCKREKTSRQQRAEQAALHF